MLRFLRPLTLRGRVTAVLGAALTLVCAVTDQRDVMLVGLLLLFVPLVATVVVHHSRLRLSLERRVTPNEVALGGAMTGQLVITHRSRFPVGLVLLEDEVPPQLGVRPRFAVDEVSQDWHRTIRHRLHGHYRGRFHTGPLRVRLTDPFGLATVERAFTATSELLVTPQVHVLDPLASPAAGGQTGDNRPHRIGVTGHDDVLVREYRDGDDVRRIHWRSTARRGELMVRREEQAWDPSMTLLLDNRTSAHAGDARHGSFEWAVSAAASIGDHFLRDGFTVELYHGQGRLDLAHVSGQREAVRHVLVRELAEVVLRPQPTLSHGLAEMQADGAGQLVVAVLGRLSPAEAAAVARVRRDRAQGIAILLDVDTWLDPSGRSRPDASPEEAGRPDPQEAVAEVLLAQRWRVVRATADSSVPEVWARVGLLQGVR